MPSGNAPMSLEPRSLSQRSLCRAEKSPGCELRLGVPHWAPRGAHAPRPSGVSARAVHQWRARAAPKQHWIGAIAKVEELIATQELQGANAWLLSGPGLGSSSWGRSWTDLGVDPRDDPPSDLGPLELRHLADRAPPPGGLPRRRRRARGGRLRPVDVGVAALRRRCPRGSESARMAVRSVDTPRRRPFVLVSHSQRISTCSLP